jgi:hypothetical protein
MPASFRSRPAILAAALGLLVVGGSAGALAVDATRPRVTMAPATPVAIRSLSDSDIITIRGRVAEIYGNKFVMVDASGRALVDTGREGEDGTLVGVGQPVTVQGRFEHGFVHAAFLVGADGKVKALGPLGRPPHDRRGPHGPRGPEADRPAPPPAAVPAPATGAPA